LGLCLAFLALLLLLVLLNLPEAPGMNDDRQWLVRGRDLVLLVDSILDSLRIDEIPSFVLIVLLYF